MKSRTSGTSASLYTLALLAFLVLIGGLGWRASLRMKAMSSASAATTSEWRSAKDGDAIKVVIEVGETDEKSLAKGKVLNYKDDTHYTRTDAVVFITFDKKTKVVMGNINDLHSGAVVHVTGKWSAGKVNAEQIVILTGYVQVQ